MFAIRCRPGRYLCDAIGNRVTSSIGYSLVYSNLNNSIRPTAGHRVILSQDFAGLGGSVRYVKSKIDADKYWGLGSGFVFSVGLEAGYIHSLEKSRGPGVDKVRLVDRWFLGQPQLRGFDIRGAGPRVQRIPYNADGTLNTMVERNQIQDDALGGRAYYLGRAELEIPLGSGARDLGLRPSVFVDAGAVFGLTQPALLDTQICSSTTHRGQPASVPRGSPCPAGRRFDRSERRLQGSLSGRLAQPSTFGGFRSELELAVRPVPDRHRQGPAQEPGDDTRLFTFNVGTQF
jgi:outer membrane protein insertion porin family